MNGGGFISSQAKESFDLETDKVKRLKSLYLISKGLGHRGPSTMQ
jgi:hypothetical protein